MLNKISLEHFDSQYILLLYMHMRNDNNSKINNIQYRLLLLSLTGTLRRTPTLYLK